MAWYRVKNSHGDFLGIAEVGEYPEYDSVGARVIGHQDAEFEELKESEVLTYQAFELDLPELVLVDKKKVSFDGSLVGHPVESLLLGFVLPSEREQHSEPYPMESMTFNLKGGLSGNLKRKT